MYKQLLVWPPTTSTVIGLGLMMGLVDYLVSGNVAQAVFVAGLFKIVCPEDRAATDQLGALLGRLPSVLGKTPGTLAVMLALGLAMASLGACSQTQLAGAQTKVAAAQARAATVAQAIQPALITACTAANALASAAGPIAPWIIAGCGTASAIDRLAADPTSTAWVNKLIGQAEAVSAAAKPAAG